MSQMETSNRRNTPQALWSAIKSAPDGFSSAQLQALNSPSPGGTERGELLLSKLLAKNFSADQIRGALTVLHGADEAAIEFLLRPEQIEKTVALLARGRTDSNKQFLTHQGAELTCEMIGDVLKRSGASEAARAAQILSAMVSYDGSPAELRDFVYTLGAQGIGRSHKTLDPYRIASDVEVVYPLYTATEAARKTTGATVNHPYQLERPAQAPGKRYLAGQQAVMAILGTFGGEQSGREKRARTNASRTSESNTFLASVRLSDLTDPDVTKSVGRASRLLARHTQIAQELQQYIEALRDAAEKLQQTVAPTAPLVRVFGLEGGSLWNRIKAKKDLPQSVSIAINLLEDPLYSSSPDERKSLRLAVLAYGLTHLQFAGSGLLEGYSQDLAIMQNLDMKGQLRYQSGPTIDSDTLARIKARLTQALSQPELSLTELGEIAEVVAPVTAFRKQRNLEELARFEAPLQAAVSLGKKLFQRNGAWLSDSAGDSIPMDRLGANILSQKFARVAGSKQFAPILNRNEFAAIRAVTRIATLVSTPEAQAASYPIGTFTDAVQAAVCAARKVQAVAKQIESINPALAARFTKALADEEQVTTEELASLNLVTLPARSLIPVEAAESKYGIRASELADRLGFVRSAFFPHIPLNNFLRLSGVARGINAFSQKSGLIVDLPAMFALPGEHEAIQQASSLVPAEQLKIELEALGFVQGLHRYKSNFFRGVTETQSRCWLPVFRMPFLYPTEAANLKNLADALRPAHRSFITLKQEGKIDRIARLPASQLSESVYSKITLPDGTEISYLDAERLPADT